MIPFVRVKALRDVGGLSMNGFLLLTYLNEQAQPCEGELAVTDKAVWELAEATGTSEDQIKRNLRALVDSGLIVRKQVAKTKGETALTVLTDLGRELLCGRGAGEGSIPSTMPRDLRELLVLQSGAFVRAVAKAWRDYEPLPEEERLNCLDQGKAFEKISVMLRDRMMEAAEVLATAHAEERQDRELVEQGIVEFECADGTVQIDGAVLKRKHGAIASVDLLFVRDTLRRVAERAPGFVTVKRLPKLVAEIGYSRTVGFVARHDAEHASRVLVKTMARGSWSRPKGIRDDFYLVTASAARFSTGVRVSLH